MRAYPLLRIRPEIHPRKREEHQRRGLTPARAGNASTCRSAIAVERITPAWAGKQKNRSDMQTICGSANTKRSFTLDIIAC